MSHERRSISRRRVLAGLIAAGLSVAGCYSFAQPSFHPGDPRDILVALSRRGVNVTSSVAGESACDDPGLTGNALHLVASAPGDVEPSDIYVYVFRPKSWEGSQTAVDACQAEYTSSHSAARVSRVDVPTYRSLGADLSPALEEALRGALEEAAEQGD